MVSGGAMPLSGGAAARDAALSVARLPEAPAPAGGGKDGEVERARRTARDFEGIFLRMLLDRMLPDDGGGLFGGGPAAGIVRGMFVDGIGANLAERRALGIADLIERNLMREPAPPAGRPAEPAAGTPVERSA
jgi:Rod binding domain-containing protein